MAPKTPAHGADSQAQHGNKTKRKPPAPHSNPRQSHTIVASAAQTTVRTTKPTSKQVSNDGNKREGSIVHDSPLGSRITVSTNEMRACVELTDRVNALVNTVLTQQNELLATLRRIANECASVESITKLEDENRNETYASDDRGADNTTEGTVEDATEGQ
ncbi:hypothetical protein N7457_005963 [Penicillium paradoxum]|uniref:uncharacterized protein n=1 Tax=Penicillium paradoxum TaxID=176176 RepID=UPI002547E1B0|nr:uncharacterized protein N7457_005963 [Penicillium paradoxum]KAJ5780803.1 hypothetical protein N7457_005963 [Penicillium paradoxum]